MLSILNRARKKRATGEAGFTLIELLVVVVILGILIAIAIPVYLNYKKSAADKSAQSDVRNAVSLLEVCNSDGTAYPTSYTSSSNTLAGCSTTNVTSFSKSDGTTMTYYPNSDKSAYIVEGTNSGGTKMYCYASYTGGSVKNISTTTAVSAYPTSTNACPA